MIEGRRERERERDASFGTVRYGRAQSHHGKVSMERGKVGGGGRGGEGEGGTERRREGEVVRRKRERDTSFGTVRSDGAQSHHGKVSMERGKGEGGREGEKKGGRER